MKKNRILKSLASIKLGVFIILALGALAAWGTLVEAHFNDAHAAQKIVYDSVWMYLTMGLLAICLIAVMIDRWPWQKRHTGFVLAHIGILVIIVGSLLTKYFGIDGSMALEIGESSRFVDIDDSRITVYASLGDVAAVRKVAESRVDFFTRPPSPEKPFIIPLAGESLRVIEFLPYAFRDQKVIESGRADTGGAIRFQLQNPRVSLTEWLVQPGNGREAAKNLGPAEIIFLPSSSGPAQRAEGRNAIVLKPTAAEGELEYEIHTAREANKIKRGRIKAGDSIETGWMGLVFRLIKFLPRAEESVTFKAVEQMTPMTMPAIKVSFSGREQWLGFRSSLRLFTDQSMYIIRFGNARKELDFDISLKEFRVGRYPGTMKAASYESQVQVTGRGETTISMNEPLKHKGFTFYQASFNEDEQGRPVASILSVNRDPGRWIKYLGSLLIVLGTIHLFYFKRKSAR